VQAYKGAVLLLLKTINIQAGERAPGLAINDSGVGAIARPARSFK